MTGTQKSATHPRKHHGGPGTNYYMAPVTFPHKLTPFFVHPKALCTNQFKSHPEKSTKTTQIRRNAPKHQHLQRNRYIKLQITHLITGQFVANGCCQDGTEEHIVLCSRAHGTTWPRKWPGPKPAVLHNGQDKCGSGRKDRVGVAPGEDLSPAGVKSVAHAPSETPSGRPGCAGYAE